MVKNTSKTNVSKGVMEQLFHGVLQLCCQNPQKLMKENSGDKKVTKCSFQTEGKICPFDHFPTV